MAPRPPGAKGRPAFELRPAFSKEWYHVVKPNVYVHRERGWKYDESEFNKKVRPFSDVEDVARLLDRSVSAAADGLTYEPGQPQGVLAEEGQRKVNLYRPSNIKPKPGGDDKPFLDFITYLIPVEADRKHLLKWCATLIARPSIRMRFSVLLISEVQGVGKTTLTTILAKLVGIHNSSFPAVKGTLSDYTTWRMNKRLAVIAEMHDGSSTAAYDMLKDAIADDMLTAHEKFEKPYPIKNWIHVAACSNSIKALKIVAGDRRWLVPGVTEEKQDQDYWKTFNNWLNDDGLSIIAQWAEDYVAEHGAVQTWEEAPPTERKNQILVEGYSDGQKFVHELGMAMIAAGRHGKKPDEDPKEIVMRLDKVRDWLAGKKMGKGSYGDDGKTMLETQETISRVLRGCGLKLGKQFEAGGVRFRVVATFDIPANAAWAQLKATEEEPVQVEKPATEAPVPANAAGEGEEGLAAKEVVPADQEPF
jgi:hypothetical protein